MRPSSRSCRTPTRGRCCRRSRCRWRPPAARFGVEGGPRRRARLASPRQRPPGAWSPPDRVFLAGAIREPRVPVADHQHRERQQQDPRRHRQHPRLGQLLDVEDDVASHRDHRDVQREPHRKLARFEILADHRQHLEVQEHQQQVCQRHLRGATIAPTSSTIAYVVANPMTTRPTYSTDVSPRWKTRWIRFNSRWFGHHCRPRWSRRRPISERPARARPTCTWRRPRPAAAA